MNKVEINNVNYVISNEEVAQFLNDYVYIDMIEDEEMEAFEAQDNAFGLLCEAVNDEPYFGKMLLEFLSK